MDFKLPATLETPLYAASALVACGLVVWAAGNTLRKVTRDLMGKFPAAQTNRRGISVDGAFSLVRYRATVPSDTPT